MPTLSSPSLIISFLEYSFSEAALICVLQSSSQKTIDFYQSFSSPAWNTLYPALNLIALNKQTNKHKNKTPENSPSSILYFELKKLIAFLKKIVSFRFIKKLNRKYRKFPYNLCLHKCIASPIIKILHQNGKHFL